MLIQFPELQESTNKLLLLLLTAENEKRKDYLSDISRMNDVAIQVAIGSKHAGLVGPKSRHFSKCAPALFVSGYQFCGIFQDGGALSQDT